MPKFSETFDKFDAAFDSIKDARLRLRGSNEFKAADERFGKLKDYYDKLKKKGDDYQPSLEELQYIQNGLDETADLVDAYLDTKKDQDELDMSVNTLKRVTAMKEAKQAITEAGEDIQKNLEERQKSAVGEEALSADKILEQSESVIQEISGAKENVHFGSKAYDKAEESFKKVKEKWDDLTKDREPGDIPSPYELEQMKAEIAEAQKLNGEYRLKKDDKDLEKNPKTEKRLRAMEHASENMDAQMKRIEQWEKEYAKTMESEAATNAQMANTASAKEELINRVDRRTTRSSAEFRRAKELAKELREEWERIEAKGPDYKLNANDVDKLEKLNNELDANCNKYMRNKGGKDLDSYEKKRRDAMGELKNYSAKTKGILEQRKKAFEKEATDLTNEGLSNEGRVEARNIKNIKTHVNGSRVFFGSKQYKNAMKAYNDSIKSWDKLTKGRTEENKFTDEELQKSKEELEKTKATIQKYFDRNKDKDLSKHPKTKARMEAMQKAYNNVDKRLRKVNQAIEKRTGLDEKEKEKELIERNKKRKEEIKNSKGVDRYMAKYANAAEEKMARLAQKKEFSSKDLKDARMAMAAAVLEARLKAPGGDKFKSQIPPTREGYEKAIKQIANSKAFKQVMPDSKITPETCKKMAKDPKAAESLMWNFNTKLIENKKQKEAVQAQQQKRKEVQKPKLEAQPPAAK